MKLKSRHLSYLLSMGLLAPASLLASASIPWNDSHIQYSGRFDNSQAGYTQFAYSASSITAKFTGTSIAALLNGPEQ